MRTFKKAMSIIFALMSTALVRILITALLYQFSRISLERDQIGIIGGKDFKIFNLPYIFTAAISIVLISMLVFNVFNIVSAFRKKTSYNMQIILMIWCIINAALYLLIPPQIYIVAFYAAIRPIILAAPWSGKLLSFAGSVITMLTIISNIPVKERNS